MLPASDVRDVYERSSAGFLDRVHATGENWAAPTTLPGWDVRDLVNHLVNEERWATELFAGATITEIGHRLDGDLLGDDPGAAAVRAGAAALGADAVAAVLDWFEGTEALYREMGVIGPRGEVEAGADPRSCCWVASEGRHDHP